MIGEAYHIAFEWSDRHESLNQCASKCCAFLSGLRSAKSFQTDWYIEGKWPEDGLRYKLKITEQDLYKWLKRGVCRRDDNNEMIPELGYSLRVWNTGSTGAYTSIGFRCGLYDCDPNFNECRIEYTIPNGDAGELLQLPVLLDIFKLAAYVWNPDSGVFNSFQLMSAIPGLGFHAGWLTYFCENKAIPLPLPDGCQIVEIAGLGNVIVACEPPFSSKDNEKVEVVRKLLEAMQAKS